ncbi:hypothetical protein EJ06DRAFT_532734 [Trichodelitschia bisporula]|uniref:Uncharacterized protein n=1 Tax=Trichodelitschia bisporula TaxID=703511 RepID=A0A6G1HP24_9PEZI|nr:hypothetical protein EJ06DRAFT_532734 [Trichodelitschia bisporula]
MNSYTNFIDQPGGAARQAPQPQQAPQMNGLSGQRHWPDLGAQMDMNVLWDYINSLAQMHEGIRAQTQTVLSGVQQIQARAAQDGSDSNVQQVNGALNGTFAGSGHAEADGAEAVGVTPQATEIARLQSELANAQATITALQARDSSLTNLLNDYEQHVTAILEKLRPYAHQQQQASIMQKAHYLKLIEDERQQNLELRLEQQRWQAGLGNVAENLRLALKAQADAELPYVKKIASLKAENRTLRRLCNLPPMEDSDDDDEEEPNGHDDMHGQEHRLC